MGDCDDGHISRPHTRALAELIGAWLHLTVSFMVWLLMGALSLTLAHDLHLSQAEMALVVALPLLSGALLRVVAGWSSDWYGAKPTGTLILVGELAACLWGWLGVHSYARVVAHGAVARYRRGQFRGDVAAGGPYLSSRPSRVGVGNCRVGQCRHCADSLFCATHCGHWTGGTTCLGGWLVPIVAILAVFMLLVRDDRRSRRAERDLQWWHNVAVMIRQPKAYWLCVLYAVTFGGFIGFCSILPLFFHEQYQRGRRSWPARLQPCVDW